MTIYQEKIEELEQAYEESLLVIKELQASPMILPSPTFEHKKGMFMSFKDPEFTSAPSLSPPIGKSSPEVELVTDSCESLEMRRIALIGPSKELSKLKE